MPQRAPALCPHRYEPRQPGHRIASPLGLQAERASEQWVSMAHAASLGRYKDSWLFSNDLTASSSGRATVVGIGSLVQSCPRVGDIYPAHSLRGG